MRPKPRRIDGTGAGIAPVGMATQVRTDMRHADEAVRAGQLQPPVHPTGGSHEKAGHAAGSTE
ncbi:hypothetical protein WJ15_21575 [Burkholderia cepacia]|nr:hypothetical protein WJ15_21575 [Burkholderia cepacia]